MAPKEDGAFVFVTNGHMSDVMYGLLSWLIID